MMMSNPSREFRDLIGKALVDKDFRDLLYNDRATALGSYQPSDEESQYLDSVSRDEMEAQSKSVASTGTTSLMITFMP